MLKMIKQRKPKLNKHIITKTNKKTRKRRSKQEKEREKDIQHYTSKHKAFQFDFDRSPQLIYSQLNKEVISKFETRRSMPENASIRKILT